MWLVMHRSQNEKRLSVFPLTIPVYCIARARITERQNFFMTFPPVMNRKHYKPVSRLQVNKFVNEQTEHMKTDPS